MQSNRFPVAALTVCANFVMFLLAAILVVQPVQAQNYKFKVLHTFHGKDGAYPVGVLVRDAEGNLYGTTGAGGSGNCSGGEGCGTAFKLDKTGGQIWLHKFNGTNGAGPNAGLIRDKTGNLFGTTDVGGDIECETYGCGTVIKLNRMGTEKVLHKFTGPPDGAGSHSLLAQDRAGNLYGTTYLGGSGSLGTVFKVDGAGKETVLYNFTGYSDGGNPYPGVILDSAGNSYGVTFYGGAGFGDSGHGVVFKVDTSGDETVLYTFGGGGDGGNPDSVLLFDSQGNLFGTTANGGTGCGGTGCGVVFKLSPQSGGNWSESVLYEFCSLSNCSDGEEPGTGPLLIDRAGNLYGTTYFGGVSNNCDGGGCGTVFKLDAAGHEIVLHSFTDGADGAFPVAGVVMDHSGNFYGTTQSGGASCYSSHACGVVFKIAP